MIPYLHGRFLPGPQIRLTSARPPSKPREMDTPPPSSRWLWPWLHVAGIGLAAAYAILWRVDFYLYVMVLFAGSVLLGVAFATLVTWRIVKQRKPWIDVPAVVLLALLLAVHVAAFGILRTISWC